MTTLLTILAIYTVGFFTSLWVMHKYKKQLDIDHYDPPHGDYYDDYKSNAEAYATFSLMWPIFLIISLFVGSFKSMVYLSKIFENKINGNTN